jgi:hypothetical protein
MANLPRRRKIGKSPALLPPTPLRGAVQVWVGQRSRRPWLRLVSWLLVGLGLGGAGLLLALSFRWGFLLILNPEALPQVHRWLQPESPPPTTSLEELRQDLASQQQTLGEPIVLSQSESGRDRTFLVIPTLASNGTITALMLFERSSLSSSSENHPPGRLIPLATVTVDPFSPSAVLAPLGSASPPSSPTPKEFAPTQLTRLPHPPTPTPLDWLTLEGQWSWPGQTWRYGQLLSVAPTPPYLELLEVWSSPANRLPQWDDLDGVGPSDLIIDETLGLEPSLRGFQVLIPGRLGAAATLQPVNWWQVPMDAGAEAAAYQKALRLARGGLWGEARDRLTALQATLAEVWNPAATAQLQTITRHADRSRRQAEQDWAIPTQQILALLIHGEWNEALVRLEANPALLESVMRRLEVDQGRLWQRIVVATALPDPDPAVLVWGGLILKAQQNDQAAEAWLARQPNSTPARQRLTAVLTPPPTPRQVAAPSSLTTPTSLTSPTTPTPITGLLGSVTPLAQLDLSRWYVPSPQAIEASLGQWYGIEVHSVHQAQGWGGPRFDHTAAALWAALAESTDSPTLTLLRWTQPGQAIPTTLSVRGVGVTPGSWKLLATGPAPEATMGTSTLPLLAFSPEALVWLDATQRQTSDLSRAIAPLTAILFPHQTAPAPGIAEVLATLPHHALDLTGNGQLEQVFTLDGPTLKQLQALGAPLDGLAPKTIILNQQNQLIYSDLFTPQTLIALTNPRQGLPLSLLVYGAGDYTLVPWSATTQRYGTF